MLLAGVLVVAVVGAFRLNSAVQATFDRQTRIQQAQVALEELLRLQIAEESNVQSFVQTKDPVYRDEYDRAVGGFEQDEALVRATLHGAGMVSTLGRMDDYDGYQNEWRREIGSPLIAHPNRPLTGIQKRNKFFSDQQKKVSESIRNDLQARNDQLVHDMLNSVNRTLYTSAFWFMVFGLLAILFNAYRSRLNRELEQERTTTQILQRAFRSEHVQLPNTDVGSAYASAVDHVAIGGDVFDMYRINDDSALMVIADVSGKGVDAAVLTAFIKFTIRSIALRLRDPGQILAEFNTAFSQTVDNPYMFVSMFVGILDTQTRTLRYASAGHDSAFIRRPGGVSQLAVTGPILGVMEEPFGTIDVRLHDGDTIVLTTDGLTEARYRNGEQLQEDGAMALIERSSPEAQNLADELIAQVRALSGNRMRDDLAVLAVRIHGDASNGAAS